MFRLRRIYFSSISEGMIWNHSHFYFLFFCSSSSVSLPYYLSFAVSLKTFIFCFLLTGPLCFVMLVFTAFYSPELPFMFYRCQQLGAHLKFYHFAVTNCHRLRCSLDVTCIWSPRNLCVNCLSFSLFLSRFYLVHTSPHTILYNSSCGSMYCMSIILWRVLSSVLRSSQRSGFKLKDKSTGLNIHCLKLSNLTTKSALWICQDYFPRIHCHLLMFDNVHIFMESKLIIFQPLMAPPWKTLAK